MDHNLALTNKYVFGIGFGKYPTIKLKAIAFFREELMLMGSIALAYCACAIYSRRKYWLNMKTIHIVYDFILTMGLSSMIGIILGVFPMVVRDLLSDIRKWIWP